MSHRPSYGAAVDWVIRYWYDYQNRMVRKLGDLNGDGDYEQKQNLVYDGNQVVMDFRRTGSGLVQTGDLEWRYLWGPAVDQILAEENVDNGSDETVQWTLTDHLNTVRDIAKYDSGSDMTTAVNHLIYDAFGKVTSESNPTIDSLFLFTGRPFDSDTQLQNNLNRWYDARVGRWLSEDPIGFAGGDPNLYRYVGNTVPSRIDPFGLQTLYDVWVNGTSVGIWREYDYPAGTFEIELKRVKIDDPRQISRIGEYPIAYIVRYRPAEGVCNCEGEEIHLVQAIRQRGPLFWRAPKFDREGDTTGYAYPPYPGQKEHSAGSALQPALPSIVDAPTDPSAYGQVGHSWLVEICAVCTTTLRRVPYVMVVQQVLGCVSFYWYQAEPPAWESPRLWIDGQWLENGMSKAGIAAKPVGSTWRAAASESELQAK
ncbi:MAG: RHS repeat-associated core domain-containing protein [Thermogutta sp.]